MTRPSLPEEKRLFSKRFFRLTEADTAQLEADCLANQMTVVHVLRKLLIGVTSFHLESEGIWLTQQNV